MTQTIKNGISSLEELFSENEFRIPQYQRAYSWEERQLAAFLDDLRQQVKTQARFPDKQYFLGTLLLHEENLGDRGRVVNIVDGQQRLTTSVVFIATALKMLRKAKACLSIDLSTSLSQGFVRNDETGRQKLHTINEDESFFQSQVLGTNEAQVSEGSPSARRLRLAVDFFSEVQADEWEPLLKTLKMAKVMVYAVNSAEDATQIFELQNDRGKQLTDLEALKSFLMHCVYLYSPKQADDTLQALQAEFAEIFRTIEALNAGTKAPEEDSVLSYHCAAFLSWTSKEYSDPKQLVKGIIKGTDEKEVIGWIQRFVTSLKGSYICIRKMFDQRDSLPEFSELLLLDHMGSYWPLLLKCWKEDISAARQSFRKVCRLLEVFTFRGHAIAGLRSNAGSSTFHTTARDFSGDFATLFETLRCMGYDHDLDDRFKAGLDSPHFYEWKGLGACYLLWRYENHLRDQPGKKQPLLRWQDFDEPRNHAAKFSLEHVAAQDNPLSREVVEWKAGDESQPFADVALHRLGNLVIDSISSNASKGKQDFAGKLKSLSQNSIYLSQGELIDFLHDPNVIVWDVNAVRKRHHHLVSFALETWDPDRWHAPDAQAPE